METLTLFSIFIIGLSYGATACMFTCMPFLAPLLVQNSTNFKQVVHVILPFSLGRVFAYTTIAVVALSSSVLVKKFLNDNSQFQMLLGGFTILLGFFMLYQTFKKDKKSCSTSHLSNIKPKNIISLFMIGALVSLNPCTPILTLVAISANSQTTINAIFTGLFFGIGAILVPFVFYGFFLSNVIRGLLVEFKKYLKYIEIFAASLLICVGILVFSGQISF